MASVTVLVTGVGGGGFGEQIFKALRLASTEYNIVVGDMAPKAKPFVEADHAYVLPPAGDPVYIETILEICKKHSAVAVFSGSEPELKVMSAGRVELEHQGIFLPINPTSVLNICLDKVKTFDFLTANGFDAPCYRRVSSAEDAQSISKFPVVLKPSVGSGGSANVFLAQTPSELACLSQYFLSLYPEFIVQEYVGTPEAEYTVGVLLGMDGELLNSIAVKRNILTSLSNRIKVANRTGRSELGHVLALSNGISQGEIGRFPEVTGPCEHIAQVLGCRGAVNIQCRFVDGRVHVFEINPRFSGTTSLRAMVGYNEPDVLIRKHVFGEFIRPRFSYASGTITRSLTETLFS